MKCETVFIYALCEPGTRTVRYIGQTNNLKGRFKNHLSLSKKKHTHLGCWIQSLGEQEPSLVVLSEVAARDRDAEEIRFIQAAKSLGIRLTNATDGGGGCYNPTPETRRKMSAVKKGVATGPHSPEWCAAISAALKGVPKGPRSLETREAISAAQKGVPKGPPSLETRAALSAALKGVPWSEARRAAYERRWGAK